MSLNPATLLIVDDETSVRESLRLVFGKDFRLCEAKTGEEALQKTEEERPDVVLLDIMMPRSDGLTVLKEMKLIHPWGQVIMLTALNTAQTAFAAKETGAFDYVTKPFDVHELRARVDRALEKTGLFKGLDELKEEVRHKYGIENMVGRSKPMADIFKAVSIAATKKSTVLITGESGTGKELIARAIHFTSDRRSKPFVVVNCAALPETLIESELFGYEKGAFTHAYQRKMGHFELAHGGSLFLDEVGELNLGIQAKFLRAIETETFSRLGGTDEVKVDVRLIAASNRELGKLSRSGCFRADLFYRLNVVPLCIPPLRERREDIPPLLNHFLRVKAKKHGLSPKVLSPDLTELLISYSWPGNVRELENLVEYLTILSPNETIALGDLPEGRYYRDPISSLRDEVLNGSIPLSEAVDGFERELISKALQKTGFNQTKAAALLGTSRRILHYRMGKLKIIKLAE